MSLLTKTWSRRQALVMGASGLAGLVATPAILRADAPYKRTLNMQSLNSGEKLKITYWAESDYIPDALKQINWFMRDLRSNDETVMSAQLLDLLWEIDQLSPSSEPLYTMSGYRTPKTNAMLASKSEGVDGNSFHMRGMAMDLTQDFNNPRMLYNIARKLGKGGVGYYPAKHPFVHVDVGPVDTWVSPQLGRPNRAAEYDAAKAEEKKG